MGGARRRCQQVQRRRAQRCPGATSTRAQGYGGRMREPGSLPFPDRPAGSDGLPGIDHIVILMKENHSYDNYFGMLGKGDGFTRGPDGTPLNSNPDRQGRPVPVHHVSLPINNPRHVSQTWNASHKQWNNGAMDGFVTTT